MSSAASDVYKRQTYDCLKIEVSPLSFPSHDVNGPGKGGKLLFLKRPVSILLDV